jgi:hypothetical protein
MNNKIKKSLLFLPVLLLMNSCIGISADIQMRRNGSGRITMEYRISRMAETVGRLDGNERWPAVPVGRADWERTVRRIDGLRLVSHSSREDAKDSVHKVTLEFSNANALVKLLDSPSGGANLSAGENSNQMQITLFKGAATEINAYLIDLLKQVSSGYKISVSFRAPGNSAMTVTDGAGNPLADAHTDEQVLPPSAEGFLWGRKVSLSVDTAEIITSGQGLGVIFNW